LENLAILRQSIKLTKNDASALPKAVRVWSCGMSLARDLIDAALLRRKTITLTLSGLLGVLIRS